MELEQLMPNGVLQLRVDVTREYFFALLDILEGYPSDFRRRRRRPKTDIGSTAVIAKRSQMVHGTYFDRVRVFFYHLHLKIPIMDEKKCEPAAKEFRQR
jgi:hypothetical protein